MIDWLRELQSTSPHALKALLAGTLVSTVCGVIGCFIVLRRTSFLADALAHAMLAGVVCGYLLMKVVFDIDDSSLALVIGSLIAGIVTVAMISFVSRFSRIKEDAVIGIMYTGIFAFGGVLLSMFSNYVHVDLAHFITGNVLAVADGDLWMMAGVAAGVLLFIILMFRQLKLISFDPVMAASIGIPVLMLEYLLTTCTSLVVVAGVNIVGVILVVGLLIIPAATAYLLCDRLSRMLVVSAFFGWTSFLLGYWAAHALNVAPGSAVVLLSAIQFLVVFLVAPRYGFSPINYGSGELYRNSWWKMSSAASCVLPACRLPNRLCFSMWRGDRSEFDERSAPWNVRSFWKLPTRPCHSPTLDVVKRSDFFAHTGCGNRTLPTSGRQPIDCTKKRIDWNMSTMNKQSITSTTSWGIRLPIHMVRRSRKTLYI